MMTLLDTIVITSLNGAMAHTCDQTCSDCMVSLPCVFAGIRKPCEDCNRYFRNQTCFDNHKRQMGVGKKTICELKKCSGMCGDFMMHKNHECYKRYCKICMQNKEVGHLCFMRPLWNVLPARDRVLYVFYDFEMTQDTNILIRRWYMNLISSGYNSSVPNARTCKILSNNACSVAKESIHFGTILLETC